MLLLVAMSIAAVLSMCDSSMPELLEIEESSKYLGRTFATDRPLAYKLNLPRYDEVSRFLRITSSLLYSSEVDRKLVRVFSDCGGCMRPNKLTTPLRIEYIPVGTAMTVVNEYLYYSEYGAIKNGPTKIHMLIVKDEFGNMSEISETSFQLKFGDESLPKHYDREERFMLTNVETFDQKKGLTLQFCPHSFIEGKVDPTAFVKDFELEQEVTFQLAQYRCAWGYRVTFKTLSSYLTSMYYFDDWGLMGTWTSDA